jgi:4'-phosphopantetheinyl transferase
LIDVWVVRVRDDGPLGVLAARALLGADADTDRRPEDDRRRSVVARGVLVALVADRTRLDPARVVISYDERGRPSIAGSALQVSIAHSGEFVACAVSDSRVGVDIERSDRPEADAALAKRVCMASELLHLEQLAEGARAPALIALWARKEAVAKALGLGLAIPFDQLEVRTDSPRLDGVRQKALRVRTLEGGPAGYSLALASGRRWSRVRVHLR